MNWRAITCISLRQIIILCIYVVTSAEEAVAIVPCVPVAKVHCDVPGLVRSFGIVVKARPAFLVGTRLLSLKRVPNGLRTLLTA